MKLKNILFLALIAATVQVSFASVADHKCSSNPAELPDWAIKVGLTGDYVGRTSDGKIGFLRADKNLIYIYGPDMKSPPAMLYWNQQTDQRDSDEEGSAFHRTWPQVQQLGVKSFLNSIGVSCGSSSQPQSTINHELNRNVLNNLTNASRTPVKIGEVLPVQGGICGEGLTLNLNTNKCDLPVFRDPIMKGCASHEDCSGGFGCYTQKSEDLFTRSGRTNLEEEELRLLQDVLLEQTSDMDLKTLGASCDHAMECSSYSCENSKCTEAKICRFGEIGEAAPGSIKCNEEKALTKSAAGKCELDPDAQNSVYLGLLNEPTLKPIGQCQFELDDETKVKSIQAMKTLRAMEWLLATISRSEGDDCFRIIPLLKDQIGKPFLDKRKVILENFNLKLAQIETDFNSLMDAQKLMKEGVKSMEPVEMHGMNVTQYELGSRQTSGFDTLMIMHRRNQLFQAYEIAMRDAVIEAHKKIASLSDAMGTWSDGASSWSLGEGMSMSAYACAAKYKKLTWKGWKTKRYSNVSNRWTDYYEVSGEQASNSNIMKREAVINYLEQMSGIKPESIHPLFMRKHYLIDPLMPGESGKIAFTQFGTKKSLRKGGLFGFLKKRDLRKPRYLKGSGSGSYTALHTAFRARLSDFYKAMRPEKTPKIEKFVYEPELVTVFAKDCIDNPANEKCEDFTKFIDEVSDIAFAQFWAYSYHRNDKYTGYFSNATTWRRRLLAKYEVDMMNISQYYDKIIQHRNVQNECIDKVLTQVENEFMNQDTQGIGEGSTNNYYSGTNYDSEGKAGSTSNYSKAPLTASTRGKFSFDLMTGGLRNLNSGGRMDNIGGTGKTSDSGSITNSSNQNSSAMAKRLAKLKDANAKASANGVDVASKEKKVSSAMSSASSSRYGASSIAANAQGSGAAGKGALGSSSYKASLSDDLVGIGDEGKGLEISGMGMGDTGDGKAQAGGPGGDIKFQGLKGGYGMGSLDSSGSGDGMSSGSGNGGQYTDPTGMSDEEKDIMMANYERNRSKYNANEEDGLFKILSKAYVRNLNKVLTKKRREILD